MAFTSHLPRVIPCAFAALLALRCAASGTPRTVQRSCALSAIMSAVCPPLQCGYTSTTSDRCVTIIVEIAKTLMLLDLTSGVEEIMFRYRSGCESRLHLGFMFYSRALLQS